MKRVRRRARRDRGLLAAARGAALIAATTSSSLAHAGAWTLEEGAGQLFFNSDVRFGDTVDARAMGESRSSSGGAMEYGLLDWITIGAGLEGRFVWGPNENGVSERAAGVGEYGGWVRTRLWRDDWNVVSAQVRYVQAGPYSVEAEPSLGDGANEIDLRLLAGRGLETAWGRGWLNAEGAYRLRTGGAVDQLRLDLTAGLRPAPLPKSLVMVQSFGTVALSQDGRSSYDLLKVGPSIGYQVSDQTTVVLGGMREVAGRNVDLGTAVTSSVWVKF